MIMISPNPISDGGRHLARRIRTGPLAALIRSGLAPKLNRVKLPAHSIHSQLPGCSLCSELATITMPSRSAIGAHYE